MNNRIEITVYGDPKAQKRHRHAKAGNFIKTYDPSSADKTDFYWICHNKRPKEPFTCALSVHMTFVFKRPKSHYGTGKNAGVLKKTAPTYHISTPDADNLCKLPIDALNKFFWKDDSQICELSALKIYGDNPQTRITIRPIT